MRAARGLRPEVAVLLQCCRVDKIPWTFGAVPDAEAVVRAAAFHRVSGFVSDHAEAMGLPPAAASALRGATMATLHRNMQTLAEMRPLLRRLASLKVPVILLKGIHLLDAVYAHPGLRPLSDVDLLVQATDAGRAVRSLEALGYRVDGGESEKGLRRDGECRLRRDGVHSVVIELHSTLNRRTRHQWFQMEDLWERSTEHPLEGEPARALCWPDAMTYLCAHAVPHAFGQLIWLRDIAGVTAAMSAADWRRLPETARSAKAARAVQAGLTLAGSALGAGVPVDVASELVKVAGPAPRLEPAKLLAADAYSTWRSLVLRATLADSPRDAAAILCGAGVRRLKGR